MPREVYRVKSAEAAAMEATAQRHLKVLTVKVLMYTPAVQDETALPAQVAVQAKKQRIQAAVVVAPPMEMMVERLVMEVYAGKISICQI
jgi:hypothetical protein